MSGPALGDGGTARVMLGSVLLLAALAAGCTLPAEQLTFPTAAKPLEGSTTSLVTPQGARRSGVPTSDAQVIESQPPLLQGSGRFTEFPNPRPLPTPDSARGGIALNLVGATVSEAAKTIIGDTLGASFVVTDKVAKARITLQTARPVPREAILELFEEVLRAEGVAIINDRGVYKLLSQDDALATGAPIAPAGTTQRSAAGLATHIIPLRFVSATEMERIIKSVAPRTNIARVDTARNLLVVVGTRAELAMASDAVSVFDVDFMRGMSFAIAPVESADPEAIVQELDTVFSNDRDGPAKGVVRFVPNKRLKAVLVISSRPEYLNKARAWIERLDMVGRNSEKQVFVYHVQGRPAGELATLLQRVYATQASPASSRIATGSIASPATASGLTVEPITRPLSVPGVQAPQIAAAATGGQSSAPTTAGSQLRGPGMAATLLNGGDGSLALDAGQPAGGPPNGTQPDDRSSGISVVADESNNSLIITGTGQQYKRILQILQRIDVTPNQVMLEATIAEVTLNDQLKFGLRWFFQQKGHSMKLSDAVSGAVSSVFPGFSYLLNTTNVQVALNALSSVTDVNVVSSPTLLVLDNKKAQLQVGDEVPIATQSAVSVVAPGSPIVNSVGFRNTGVILSITPRISDQGRILLDVEQEVSDVVPTTSSNIDSPTIQQRRVRTMVSVNDGESIFLAGLIQDRASVSRDQVPLLGNVPLIGNAFKNKTDTVKRTELVIAITPTIVKDSRQSQAVTAEFRDRLNLSLRPQRAGPPDRREQIDRLVR